MCRPPGDPNVNTTCILSVGIEDHELLPCTSQIFFFIEHEPAATPVIWTIIEGPFVGTAEINELSGAVIYQNPAHSGQDWFIVKVTSLLNTTIMDTANITFTIDECEDCNSTFMGTQIVDLCGVCGGDSTSCQDCKGIPNGVFVLDQCGVCGGDDSTCTDCFGVVAGPGIIDSCEVCRLPGDPNFNSTCGFGAGGGGILIFLAIAILGLLVLSLFLSYYMYSHMNKERHPQRKSKRLRQQPLDGDKLPYMDDGTRNMWL